MNKFKIWLRNKLKVFLEIDKVEDEYKKIKKKNAKIKIKINILLDNGSFEYEKLIRFNKN